MMSHPVQFVQLERADFGEIDRLTVPPENPRPKHRKKKNRQHSDPHPQPHADPFFVIDERV